MQQFVVPQFIDVEDKIIGPITVRQFIILLVGAGFCFIAYKLADFTLFLTEAIIVMAITAIFAFVRVNGRPFHYLLLNFFQTFRRSKVRVWQKQSSILDIKVGKEVKKVELPPEAVKTRIGTSRLAELSLVVDTGGVYQGENSPE